MHGVQPQGTSQVRDWPRYQLPLVVFLALIVVESVVPGFTTRFSAWPFVVSLVLIGMPHGALDLALSSRLKRHAREPSAFRRVGTRTLSFRIYLLTLAVMLALLIAWPMLAVGLFGIFTVLHFGDADARDLWRRFRLADPIGWGHRFHAAARGFFFLSLPFAFSPVRALETVRDVVVVCGGDAPAISVSLTQTVAGIVLLLAAAGLFVKVVRDVRTGRRREAIAEAGECLILAIAFATLDPLFAVGTYLIAWHGWRHLFTISPYLQGLRGDGWSIPIWLAWIHARSWALLVPTLILFFAVAAWRLPDWSASQLATLALAFYVVVTLPHHVLVDHFFSASGVNDRVSGSPPCSRPRQVAA